MQQMQAQPIFRPLRFLQDINFQKFINLSNMRLSRLDAIRLDVLTQFFAMNVIDTTIPKEKISDQMWRGIAINRAYFENMMGTQVSVINARALRVYTDYILTAFALYTFAVPAVIAVSVGLTGAVTYKYSRSLQRVTEPVFKLFNSLEKQNAVHAVGILGGIIARPALLLTGSAMAGFRLTSYLLKTSHSPVAILVTD
jgi:hypothetical protein